MKKLDQKVEIELNMCFAIILKAQLLAGVIIQNNIHVEWITSQFDDKI